MTTDSDSLRFGCPKCQRRLKAPPSLAGSRTRCPYCQVMIDVPRHSRSNDPADVYPLQTDESELLNAPLEYVLVICPVCHSRMHPEVSQIGKQAICPDCGTATTVQRPPEKPVKKPPRSPEEIGEYPLATEVRPDPGAVPAAEQDYVAVVCSLCHTRMLGTADQVGSKMICPDCGTATVVPPMPRPRPKIDVMKGADQGYTLIGLDDVQPARPTPPRVRRVQEEPPQRREPPDEPEIKLPSRHPALPDRPFLDGTFTFPFHRSVWVRTLVLSLWSILPGLTVTASLSYRAAGDATRDAGPLFASALLMVVTAVLFVLWFAIMSATMMAVLRETSEGCDEIENWPGQVFLDWLGEPLHLLCALCMSAVPGAAAAWLLEKLGLASPAMMWITGPASMFVMFPIVLMSTLETNSMFGVLSWPVLRTLRTTADAWLKFYMTAAAMIVAVVALCWVASRVGVVAGVIVAAALETPAWIIYFRLLGRLAWVCADRAAFDDLEAELAEAGDDDFDEDSDDDNLLR